LLFQLTIETLLRMFLLGSWLACGMHYLWLFADVIEKENVYAVHLQCWCTGNDNLSTSYLESPANKPLDVLSVQGCLHCAVMLRYILVLEFVLEHYVNTDYWGATCFWYEAVIVLFDYGCQLPLSLL
jgi:hypothetical protein